jgi:hypothetical protein
MLGEDVSGATATERSKVELIYSFLNDDSVSF